MEEMQAALGDALFGGDSMVPLVVPPSRRASTIRRAASSLATSTRNSAAFGQGSAKACAKDVE